MNLVGIYMTEQLQQLDELASHIKATAESIMNEQPETMEKNDEEAYFMAIGMYRMALNTQVTLKNIHNSLKE